jgi:hypothetical protein
MIVAKQSSQPFATLDRAVSGLVGFGVGWKGDDVVESLMGPLGVVVDEVLFDGVLEHWLAEEDHPFGTLLLDRSHEAFGKGVQVRRVCRKLQSFDATRARNAAREVVRCVHVIVPESATADAVEPTIASQLEAGRAPQRGIVQPVSRSLH